MRTLLASCMLIAACGDDNRTTVDAAISDAEVVTPDADPDAAVPTGLVKLTVREWDGTGVAGVRVHFQNADSTVVLTTTTDANGVASAMMADGGYVTAVDAYLVTGEFPTHRVLSFAGVKAGDELELLNPNLPADTSVSITGPADTGPTNYFFATSCLPSGATGPGSPTATVPYASRCPTTADVLMTSRSSTTNELKNYVYAAAQPVGAPIDLSTATLVAPIDRTYTLTSVPGAATISVKQLVGATEPWALWGDDAALAGTTTRSGSLKIPAFAGARNAVRAKVSYNDLGAHYVQEGGTALTDPITIDVGPRLLPEISAPSLDASTRTVMWTESAGAAPQLTAVTLHLTRGSETIQWRTVSPHTAASVQLPAIPVENNLDVNPRSDDASVVYEMWLGAVPGGYDAIRETALLLDGTLSLPIFQSGTVTASVLTAD